MDALKEGEVGTIEGVGWRPLRVIADERGTVLHMLRADSPEFTRFGEVYFSEVLPGVVKGWKLHLRMTQRLAVPAGRITFVIYDRRKDSATSGKWMRVEAGRPEDYGLLVIASGLWYSFGNSSQAPALIANCSDLMHDPLESQVLPLDTPEIAYRWPA